MRIFAIFLLIFSTALSTPLPLNLFGSESLSSKASLDPVLAPDGTEAEPIIPPSNSISTPTVGFPLESSISLPITDFILYIFSSSNDLFH